MLKIIFGAAIGAAILAQSDVAGIWAQWGLAGIVIGITMWRDWQREQRCQAEVQRLTSWIESHLLAAIDRSTAALAAAAELSAAAARRENRPL